MHRLDIIDLAFLDFEQIKKSFDLCGVTTSNIEKFNPVLKSLLSGEVIKNVLEETEGEQEINGFVEDDFTDDDEDEEDYSYTCDESTSEESDFSISDDDFDNHSDNFEVEKNENSSSNNILSSARPSRACKKKFKI